MEDLLLVSVEHPLFGMHPDDHRLPDPAVGGGIGVTPPAHARLPADDRRIGQAIAGLSKGEGPQVGPLRGEAHRRDHPGGVTGSRLVGILQPVGQLREQIRPVAEAARLEKGAFDELDEVFDAPFLVA
jgi:hypothetical protein